jgi:hypothetical protein
MLCCKGTNEKVDYCSLFVDDGLGYALMII